MITTRGAVCAALLLWSSIAVGASAPKIAVVVDGPSDLNQRVLGILADEVDALFTGAPALPRAPTYSGDFTLPSATQALEKALSSREYDMVVAIGYHVGVAVAARDSLPKPVFLPYAAPDLQGLPRAKDISGRRNLSYLTGLLDLERELRRFRDVIRRDKSVFLIDRVLVDDVAELQKVVSSRGGDSMETQVLPVDADAASILAAIPTDAQAVYIGALLRLPNDQMKPLIDGLNARRLPTYASQGRPWVELGAFTSTVPADEEQRRMRRIALYIQESTVGGKLESFATTFERRTELVINMTTARKIRVYPRFELMTEAKLIDDDPEDRGEPLSLNQAVDLALAANRDLVATRRDAKIADADVDGALSVFVPQVSVNGEATWIDPDVASPFFNSERALGYSITGSQLIYGAGAIPGVRAQQAARRSVTAAIQSVELDTVQDAATAYLDVLRARTAERINRENLERVRQNLALAEVRVEIGSAGRQEVFRWENEIADSRVDVIAASAIRNQTEIQLNRIINRPLEQNFSTVDPSSGEIGPVVLESVARFIDDPWSFKVFRDFAAEEAKDNSPELKQLREAITSNEQVLSGRRQQLFLPDLLVSGGVSHTPIRGGVGSEEVPGGGGIPQRVDWQWQLAAALSFNVFDYTRYPEIEKTKQTIRQLNEQREALEQRIEQGVRSALHQTAASRAAVKLRRDAAKAAEQNLALVTDAYRQGTVNVITLIDAQNQALSANLAAANAVYDFLIDYVAAERAAGEFGFNLEKEERDAVVERLQRFFLERSHAEGE